MRITDRHELALECLKIEKAGGSVREFLAAQGCVSPWGTWFRLQKEELLRSGSQITEGKGDKMGRRIITQEQKDKAVQIAVSGGNPREYLATLGFMDTMNVWCRIKKAVKESDPELYARIPKRIDGDGRKPAETKTAEAEPAEAAEEKKPASFGKYEVTAIRDPQLGEFYFDAKYNCIDWRTLEGDEVSLPIAGWQTLAEQIPEILGVLGVKV